MLAVSVRTRMIIDDMGTIKRIIVITMIILMMEGLLQISTLTLI